MCVVGHVVGHVSMHVVGVWHTVMPSGHSKGTALLTLPSRQSQVAQRGFSQICQICAVKSTTMETTLTLTSHSLNTSHLTHFPGWPHLRKYSTCTLQHKRWYTPNNTESHTRHMYGRIKLVEIDEIVVKKLKPIIYVFVTFFVLILAVSVTSSRACVDGRRWSWRWTVWIILDPLHLAASLALPQIRLWCISLSPVVLDESVFDLRNQLTRYSCVHYP